MRSLVSTTEQAPSFGFGFAGFVRAMVQSWLAHHQRLAEGGVQGDH